MLLSLLLSACQAFPIEILNLFVRKLHIIILNAFNSRLNVLWKWQNANWSFQISKYLWNFLSKKSIASWCCPGLSTWFSSLYSIFNVYKMLSCRFIFTLMSHNFRSPFQALTVLVITVKAINSSRESPILVLRKSASLIN